MTRGPSRWSGAPPPSIFGLVAALALALPAVAAACELPPGTAPVRIQSPDTVVLYRTMPPAIEVGKHFAIEARVCTAAAPTGLRVDAQMPAHRHGMNYRARVAPKGGGRYVADGLLFHMPGRWQFTFDVERGPRVERLTHDVDIR